VATITSGSGGDMSRLNAESIGRKLIFGAISFILMATPKVVTASLPSGRNNNGGMDAAVTLSFLC